VIAMTKIQPPSETHASSKRNSLDAFWMPFTSNRQFKDAPRLVARADGMYFETEDGRKVMDAVAGLWCVNAGHNCRPIVEAIKRQAEELDYASCFQMGHTAPFGLADRLAAMMPEGLDHVFFTNSGSESADTALKIALGYHSVRGDARRIRMVGREKGYHGVGFGGMSVGGIGANRKFFGPMLPGVDHLPHTHNLKENAFSRGLPEWGAHLADDLQRIVDLHDASTIACVIVEPFAGGGGVFLPPKGYLKRLREICDHHGILLIFDEVITAFGRFGAASAAEVFGVTPDIMTTAKALTNGSVPMGAVFVRREIYEAFMTGDPAMIEFCHGYTYSAHPLACAAANASMDVYLEQNLFGRVRELAPYWENALHDLAEESGVVDVRNFGLLGAIELDNSKGTGGRRAYEVYLHCWRAGVCVRYTANNIVLTPPLIVSKDEIDVIREAVREGIRAIPA
jgi:beta-alanine--pyruvate transaminase